MINTTTESLPIQLVGSTTPSVLGRAGTDEPARVLIQHVAGGVIFISVDTNDVCPSAGLPPTAKCFRLLPNTEKVFVISPKQALFAVGGGMVSVSVSGLIQGETSVIQLPEPQHVPASIPEITDMPVMPKRQLETLPAVIKVRTETSSTGQTATVPVTPIQRLPETSIPVSVPARIVETPTQPIRSTQPIKPLTRK